MGKIAAKILASGRGWSVRDVVCAHGPQDKPYEEQHDSHTIAVVIEGSFQYRSKWGSEILSPGALLLGNYGGYFECGHEHGTGDRCISFQYSPEFFERAGAACLFPVHRIPPLAALAPWVVEARLTALAPEQAALEETAHGMAGAVLETLGRSKQASRAPTAADLRRVSATLRLIEANLEERLPLGRLAAAAKMSEFHFLRVFKQVTQVTPHQYILRARLREAALRLKTSASAVLDVALDMGFGDISNFNHAFRAEFGANPQAYRLRARGYANGNSTSRRSQK